MAKMVFSILPQQVLQAGPQTKRMWVGEPALHLGSAHTVLITSNLSKDLLCLMPFDPSSRTAYAEKT